ncbi:monocyte chemotactic 1B-like protein [Labeo rohita]|uniref:Monocyte chemotactic 1B-like protein n=1 Tax=Labeo rohita TaxID=84645 RepID=A0A498NGI5_LABRO|nr:monocyte chemotactic 1B-like protein [Labeo rohita]
MKSHMLGFYAVLLLWLLVSSSVQDGIIIGSVCLTTSDTKVPPKNLVSYTNQRKPLFPVDAVSTLQKDGRPVTCCLKLGRSKPPLDRVLNYTIQTKRLCPITAVVIQTVYGKRLCSDPNSDWTKRAMWKVDGAKMKPREQDVVPAERTSAEGRRGRMDECCGSRFHTKKNKVICSDPTDNWAKRVMKIVDDRTTTKPSQKSTMGYTNTAAVITCGTVTKTTKKLSKMMIRKKGKKSKNPFGMSGPETSTSTPVPPIVMPIEMSGPETSTSTPVPPIVTTIKFSGPEISMSITVPPIVTTTETSEKETSKSTNVPPTVTTIETSGPETSKTTTQPTSVSKDNPESSLSTATTFQMDETVTYGVVGDDMLGFLRESM